MEMVEISDVDEEAVLSFIKSIPRRWNKGKSVFKSSLHLLLSRLGETDEVLFGVYIFSSDTMIAIFLEYHRETKTAIFEIRGFSYRLYYGDDVDHFFLGNEKRMKEVILENLDKVVQD